MWVWLALAAAAEQLAVVEHMDHAAMETLQTFVSKAAMESAFQDSGVNHDSCQQCVEAVGKRVMEYSLGKLKKSCEESKDPKWEHICAMMAHHPEQTVGAMIVWARPQPMAEMFCLGHGDCHSHEEAEAAAPEEYSMAAFPLSAALMHSERMHSELTGPPGPPPPPPPHGPGGKGKGKGCPFIACVMHATGKVLEHFEDHLVEECKKTECPKMKAFCEWGYHHQDMAQGMVAAHTEPWKFAIGGCFEHFHHHHGPHDGPPPPPPPHGSRLAHLAHMVQHMFV